MSTGTVRLTRFTVCATMITAVSAWAFLSSTACGERDPFRFASIMVTNAKAQRCPTAGSQHDRPLEEVTVYTPPDLLAVPPPCLGSCA